ncbi:phosphomannomutase [Rhodoplanes elegans]|uniref:Phosphomannomutase n=1 Tax=Rhodoplanes elegans TaxID=29408 RepID=A0A327KR68_9BRAD|nr:cytochrome c [Rhodoplanes elegans]MBK5957874.1 phosphomannomutase [Rhodoplanes elegans]RAI40921.1 phosphomannomutase [Rhodoplanes elegans]
MLGRQTVLAVAVLVAGTSGAATQGAVERGAYLVNTVMTCHNCHTPIGPNGPDLARAFSGGTPVFDTPAFRVRGSNITPDKQNGIGTWSEADIEKALRDGVRPNGVPLAPPMPTGFYGVLTSADGKAIAVYLKSLKASPNKVEAPVYNSHFERELFPGADKPADPAALQADKVKLGEYLVTIAHCMECHTPRIDGKLDFSAVGAGRQEFAGPWGTSIARNITSHPQKGLKAWTDDEIKRAITQGVSRDGSKLKPPMGYGFYARMTAGDLDAVVAYLRTLPPRE